MHIKDIEYYLPKNVLDNRELEKLFPEWDSNKIEKKTGIKERHIADQNETALNLAIHASEKLFVKYDKSKIDYILFCTQSPDYFLPSNACILQDKLKLKREIGAFDFNLGCSGYIYGLAIAKSLISTKLGSHILLVTSDTYSKYIHPLDRSNRTIFGDGASVTVIEQSDVINIHEFVLGTDGSGFKNLIIPYGGLKHPYDINADEVMDESGSIRTKNHLFMNGPEIFNFTIDIVPMVIQEVIKKNNTTLEEIDYFILHQANQYILEYLRKKMNIPKNKYFIDMLHTGNTVSTTIPIALKEAKEKNIIKQGDKILLLGFGVGYSWGGTIITL